MYPSVLSQSEVDALMRGIDEGTVIVPFVDIDALIQRYRARVDFRNNLASLEERLLSRHTTPEPLYGIFSQDVTVVTFFDDAHGDKTLADIRAKNEEKRMGNVKIPGTDIELINYSSCPQCHTNYDFSEVMTYYRNPVSIPGVNRPTQLREDTRMQCFKECRTFFFPTVVLVKGTPQNEVQMLCRMQTIQAVEKHYTTQFGKSVLTLKPENRVRSSDGKVGILNDVRLEDLQSKPSLLTNLLQYTPAPLMLSFIAGEHLANGEVVYGAWK